MQWLILIFPTIYAILLAYLWKHLRKAHQFEGSGTIPEIFISVIIPCRNEEQHLPLILSDLRQQSYPATLFEVMVSDDNSSDSTYELAGSFRGITNYTVLKNQGMGKKQAIRTAIGKSSGELVITTDADCRLNDKWLAAIASFYINKRPEMIICPVMLDAKPGIFGRFQELEFLSLQGITAGAALSGHPVMCNGANLAFRRQAYLRNSGNLYDEVPTGDDIFLLHSLKKESAEIMWLRSTDAIVSSMQAADTDTFMKQRRRWLSKWRNYSDPDTIILSIVTFVTNLTLIYLLISALFNSRFVFVLACAFIIKAIPDYMILSLVTAGYKRKSLMKWFLPSAVIYPFYVLVVSVLSFSGQDRPGIRI